MNSTSAFNILRSCVLMDRNLDKDTKKELMRWIDIVDERLAPDEEPGQEERG